MLLIVSVRVSQLTNNQHLRLLHQIKAIEEKQIWGTYARKEISAQWRTVASAAGVWGSLLDPMAAFKGNTLSMA